MTDDRRREPKGIPTGGRFAKEEAGGSGASDLDDRMGDEIKDLDESDPCAVVRYLDSLDPGVRASSSRTRRGPSTTRTGTTRTPRS